MTHAQVIRQSRITREFEGFDEETLFQLDDGSNWLQAQYHYWYHYAYRPEALVFRENGRLYIEVCGRSISVRQTQVHVRGTIDGAFRGWNGRSCYKLTNGQVWEQSAYHYAYKYAYRPTAVVYDTSSGTVMAVEGTHARVRRVR